MARSRGFARRGFTGSTRRKSGWSLGPQGLSASLAATGSAIVANGAAATVDGLTVIRTRGNWTIDVSVLPDLGTNQFELGLGLMVATSAAFSVGITALPTPLTDIGFDGWLWHWNGIAGVVPGMVRSTATGVVSVEVDSKAMRKITFGQVVVGIVEVIETGTAGTLVTELESRMLSKLA